MPSAPNTLLAASFSALPVVKLPHRRALPFSHIYVWPLGQMSIPLMAHLVGHPPRRTVCKTRVRFF
jgi:hypothetical protein